MGASNQGKVVRPSQLIRSVLRILLGSVLVSGVHARTEAQEQKGGAVVLGVDDGCATSDLVAA
jgi:hypothetical protein